MTSNAIPARLLDARHLYVVCTFVHRWSKLKSLLLEVIGESSNDCGGVSGHLGLVVEADNDGLLAGGNGNTLTTSSCIDVVVIQGQDKALSRNIHAVSVRLVGGSLASVDEVGNGLHLGGLDRQIGRSSPGTVASFADDGTPLDVAGADQASINEILPSHDGQYLGQRRGG